jgi:hypothetical protein
MQRALSPTADIPSHTYGAAPCQEATYASHQRRLVDHLVGAGEEHRFMVGAPRPIPIPLS